MDITSSTCSEIVQNSANVKIEWEISEMPETDTAMKEEQKDVAQEQKDIAQEQKKDTTHEQKEQQANDTESMDTFDDAAVAVTATNDHKAPLARANTAADTTAVAAAVGSNRKHVVLRRHKTSQGLVRVTGAGEGGSDGSSSSDLSPTGDEVCDCDACLLGFDDTQADGIARTRRRKSAVVFMIFDRLFT